MKKSKIINDPYGHLYIIPTPIGNLSDITYRALEVLQKVDLVAAENVIHTSLLLQHFGIKSRLFSLNNRNEQRNTKLLIEKLKNGENIALVADAGTPLINDSGYCLVRDCRTFNIRVIPLPGPCSAITALSASGLSTNRFCYEGFLPPQSKKRLSVLKKLEDESRTIIFCESTHRLLESLNDMISVWGHSRYVVLARELTKKWETIYGAPVGELVSWIKEDENRRKGEMILIVEGYKVRKSKFSINALRTISLLQVEFSLKKSVALTAKIHGIKKNLLYRYMIENKIMKY